MRDAGPSVAVQRLHYFRLEALYSVSAISWPRPGSEQVLDLALQQWNATTRISDEGIRHRVKNNDLPGVKKKFTSSGYRE